MSAATASSTETVTVFVRLLDEGTDAWRPVQAMQLSEATFQLCDTPTPADERWAFGPGELVVAEHQTRKGWPEDALIVVARAVDIDPLSVAATAFAAE